MKFKIGIILVFLGSVFLTSEKFVDTENAAKFYFTLIALLVCAAILVFRNTNLYSSVQKITSLPILKWFFIIGALQAIYGILQYMGKYPSNHNAFAITGSFDNPAGFAAVLSLLFPIGVYWCVKSKKNEQRFVFILLGIILFSIILAGSRTGILAIIISTISIFIVEFQLLSKIQHLKHVKQIVLFTIIILLFSLSVLYKWRPDSANGRLLIWNVSTEIIKSKPLIGFGNKGFQANYMDYQAQYFELNPNSIFKQLADNVTHPFNEFILIAVNYGIIGLLLFVLLISFILWKLFRPKHLQRSLFLSGYISFLTLSLFSYPLQYAPIWLLLVYYTICVFSEWLPRNKLSLIIRIPIVGGCIMGIIFFSLRMNHELEWKDITVKSLQGKTKQMLPKYEKLYPHMKHNELFLYNYGAELNITKHYSKSITLLNECRVKFNDFDLQMLLADNYSKNGESEKAIQTFQHASNMIPCRFIPLYQIFEIYKDCDQKDMAVKYANLIINKKIKIPSMTINSIKAEAKKYLEGKHVW